MEVMSHSHSLSAQQSPKERGTSNGDLNGDVALAYRAYAVSGVHYWALELALVEIARSFNVSHMTIARLMAQ
jgi:hypothetical protein